VLWKRIGGEGDELSDLKGENHSFPRYFTVPQHKRRALNG
jgi:hypothetical protein